MNIRWRKGLVVWHRWFGLFAALWLTLMGITGSIIVFYDELDVALNPASRKVTPGSGPLPVSEVVQAAEAHRPGSYAGLVDLPRTDDEPMRVFLRSQKGSGAEIAPGTYLLMDPYRATVLSERAFGAFRLDREHLMDFIYELHIDLMLGPWMVWFLGLVAFLWIIDHIAAAVLSFPVAAKWIQSFRIRRRARGHKLVFDLHRAGGLWFFPATLILAVSGTYLNWYDEFTSVVEVFSPITPRYNVHAPELDAPLYGPPVTFTEAVSAAAAVAGEQVDMLTYFPWQGLYLARAYDTRRDVDSYGRRMIAVDARSGAVLDDFHASTGTAGDVFVLWQYPLHSGKAFGWTGRLIIFASGILVTMFSVTGILIWSRKRRARGNKRT